MNKKTKQDNQTSTPEDEYEKIQQAILMREVEEELQKERLMNFWNRYRFLIIGGLIAVVGVTAGSELHRSWYEKVKLAESNRFEQAVVMDYKGEKTNAYAIFNELSRSSKTGYGVLSEMRLAEMALENNQMDEALKHLNSVINNSKAPKELRETARLTVVGHQIGTGNPETLMAELNPILNQPNNPLYASAVELKVALLIQLNKSQEAKEVIETALKTPTLSETGKERLNAMLSIMQ